MSTRLRRPSIWRQLLVTAVLLAFQGYLGWSAIGGNFGIESQRVMRSDIEDLKAQSASLQAELESYRHRVNLFDPARLDPDILTERARALLSMAQVGDIVIMPDPMTGKLTSSLYDRSTENQSMAEIIATAN